MGILRYYFVPSKYISILPNIFHSLEIHFVLSKSASFPPNRFHSLQIHFVPSKSIWFPRNTFRSCCYCRMAPYLYAAFIYCRLTWHVTWIHFEGRKSIWSEGNLFGGNEMYLEGTILFGDFQRLLKIIHDLSHDFLKTARDFVVGDNLILSYPIVSPKVTGVYLGKSRHEIARSCPTLLLCCLYPGLQKAVNTSFLTSLWDWRHFNVYIPVPHPGVYPDY